MPNETASVGKHPVLPLPFDSTKLRGLSEPLIRSHHENNYGGAVKNLNQVEEPLLVLDMYEHSYQMDYGAAAAKYIDAFFRNINWDEVNSRLERAEKAAAVLGAR